ncbi:hypothetical protein FACS189472_09910 [Alphaproteobacteria bacterium]|nr:hypothetical protein FACS189472_09910 [Alphaproteobacteria bacterium]
MTSGLVKCLGDAVTDLSDLWNVLMVKCLGDVMTDFFDLWSGPHALAQVSEVMIPSCGVKCLGQNMSDGPHHDGNHGVLCQSPILNSMMGGAPFVWMNLWIGGLGLNKKNYL